MTDTRSPILAIIPARGGSKSIPKKSIAPLAGYPLLYYTIRAAQASLCITRAIVSTDDTEIADAARRYGVEVPFRRPTELAQDLTPDLPVFEHALAWLQREEGYVPELVVHLRPTTPLKSATDIDRAIDLLLAHPEADSVHSMCSPLHSPFKMARMGEDGYLKPFLTREFPEIFSRYREIQNMPRQAFPEIWRHSGQVDAIRTTTITMKGSMSGERILPLFFDEARDIDIDSPRDLAYAELVVTTLRARGKEPWQDWH